MPLSIILTKITAMDLWDGGDFYSFMIRFLFHFVGLFIIVRFLYYPAARRRDYLFTYFLISTVIFLMCFLLENVKLELGMALGLFAVFGIIRYRTSQISIKEMTYLFIVIGLAVINALANKKISLTELVAANLIIVGVTWILERGWSIQHISSKVVQYDKIGLIRPEHHNELINDLKDRLGLDIYKVEVGKVDFLRDSAKIVVYYKSLDKRTNRADDIESYNSYHNDDD